MLKCQNIRMIKKTHHLYFWILAPIIMQQLLDWNSFICLYFFFLKNNYKRSCVHQLLRKITYDLFELLVVITYGRGVYLISLGTIFIYPSRFNLLVITVVNLVSWIFISRISLGIDLTPLLPDFRSRSYS